MSSAVRRARSLACRGAAGVFFSLAFASSARADDAATDPAGSVHLAFRTGYGIPFGKYADVRTIATVRFDEVNAIGDDTYGVVPLWIDAGYWLGPNLLLGAYFMFGLVFPRTAPSDDPLRGGCPEGFECSAIGLRAGIQAQYAFSAGDRVRPWVGLGIGYEWVGTHAEGNVGPIDFELDSESSGPELIHVQGGADFMFEPGFGLGPFVSVSALRYTSCGSKISGEEQDCEIDSGAWHGWIAFGARGAFDF